MNSRKPDCKTQQQEENVVPFFRFLKQPEFQVGGPNSITSNSVYISFCCFHSLCGTLISKLETKAGSTRLDFHDFMFATVREVIWRSRQSTPNPIDVQRKRKKKFPPAPSIRPILNHIPTFLFLWVCWLRKREQWERKRRENKCHQPLSPTGIHTSTSHTCYRCNTASFPSLPFFSVLISLFTFYYMADIISVLYCTFSSSLQFVLFGNVGERKSSTPGPKRKQKQHVRQV